MDSESDDSHTEAFPAGHSMTAADFVRNFGKVRQMSDDTVIYVTHHGRTTHALLSLRRYQDVLSSRSGNGSDKQDLQALLDCIPNPIIILSNDLTVLQANRAADALLCKNDQTLKEKCLFEYVPELGNSLVAGYTYRAIRSKERSSFELPRLIDPKSWTRFDVHPFSDHVVLTILDITEDVARHRMFDERKAIRNAVAVHEGVSFVCLTKRGHIEQCDRSFADLVQLPEDRLRHVLFSELIPRTYRVAFREELERILCDGVTRRHTTCLLRNDGDAVEAFLSIAPLESLYGIEGALLLITRC